MFADVLTLWIAVGLFFLIVEILTVTFYGLAIAGGCFVTALYAWIFGETDISIIQGIIFAISTSAFAYFLPKLLTPPPDIRKVGISAHEGRTFTLKEMDGDYKITIDGVDYLIDADSITDAFAAGKKVRLDSTKEGVIHVSLVS